MTERIQSYTQIQAPRRP